jgi:hypothetical protein
MLDAQTLTLHVQLRNGDKRSFAIAAVDAAGNVGAPTAMFMPATGTIVKQAQSTPVRRPRRK